MPVSSSWTFLSLLLFFLLHFLLSLLLHFLLSLLLLFLLLHFSLSRLLFLLSVLPFPIYALLSLVSSVHPIALI